MLWYLFVYKNSFDILNLYFYVKNSSCLTNTYYLYLKMDKLWRTVLKRTANQSDQIPNSCFPPLAAWCVKSSFCQLHDKGEYDRAAEKLLNACLRSMGHFAENCAVCFSESELKNLSNVPTWKRNIENRKVIKFLKKCYITVTLTFPIQSK